MNQCDGCARDLALINGLHYDGKGGVYMACSKDKYDATSPTPVALPEMPTVDPRDGFACYEKWIVYATALRTAAEQLQRRCAELGRELKFMPSMRAQRNAADNRANALTERLAECEKALTAVMNLGMLHEKTNQTHAEVAQKARAAIRQLEVK